MSQPAKVRKTEESGSVKEGIVTEFNENSDFDDMVSDMVKEELQLLVTRLVQKKTGIEGDLKGEILRIIKSRSKTSQLPLSRQLIQLQELLNSSQSQVAGTNLVNLLTQQIHGTQLMGGAPTQDTDTMASLGLPISRGASSSSAFGFVGGLDIANIRRKIRDAFVKTSTKRGRYDTKDIYNITTNTVKFELEEAKSAVLAHAEIRKGLSRLEAITDEFVSRGTELGGDSYVNGYANMLKEIARCWVDVFLFEELETELDEEERVDWEKKISGWDTSAKEEESTFACAKAAVRGWSNVHLKQVLKGEHIGKFKEPTELTVARLQHLERKKEFEQAVNLAKAVDLHFYHAKNLCNLGRTEEVKDICSKIEDPEKIFTIAQLVRANTVEHAFDLAVKAIQVEYEWNNSQVERAKWLIDLSIANKMLDKLVEKVQAEIRHKTVQFQISQILKEKEQYKHSLMIMRIVIVPYSEEDIEKHAKKPAEAPKQPEITVTGVPIAEAPKAPSKPIDYSSAESKMREEYDVGAVIPSNATTWMWKTVYEMVLLELCEEKEMDSVVEHIISNIKNIDTLLGLISVMKDNQEYESAIKVGLKTFEYIQQQQEEELEIQKELIKAVNELDPSGDEKEQQLLVQQQQEIMLNIQMKYLKSARRVYQNLPMGAVSMNYNAKWDSYRLTVSQSLMYCALDSATPGIERNKFAFGQKFTEKGKEVNPLQVKFESRSIKTVNSDRTFEIADNVSSNLRDYNHLSQMLNICTSKSHYKLGLKICAKCHELILTMSSEKKKTDKLSEELAAADKEVSEILQQRKKLKDDISKKLKDLKIRFKVNALKPYSWNSGDYQFKQWTEFIATCALSYAYGSKVAENPSDRLSDETIEKTLEQQLSLLSEPQHFINVANSLVARKEWEAILKVGRKCKEILDELKEKIIKQQQILIPMQIIEAEQQALVEKRQQLPPKRMQDLQKLQKEYEEYEKVPLNLEHITDYYASVASVCLSACFASKQKPKAPFKGFGFGLAETPAVRMQKMLEKEWKVLPDELISQIITECLGYKVKPRAFEQFLRSAKDKAELDFGIEMIKISFTRFNEMMEERIAFEKPRLKYQQLLNDKRAAEEKKRNLTPEELKEFQEKELEQKLVEATRPNFTMNTHLDEFHRTTYTLIESILGGLFDKKAEITEKLEALIQEELTSNKKMDIDEEADNKMEIEPEKNENGEIIEKETKESLTQDLQTIRAKIQQVTALAIETIKNPEYLVLIAQGLQRHAEYDLCLEIGTKIEGKIVDLQKEKEKRDVIRTEYQELLDEEKDTEEKRKVTKAKAKMDISKAGRLKELEIETSFLRIYPSFENYQSADFERIQVDNAEQMLTSCISAKEHAKKEMELRATPLSDSEKEEIYKTHDKKIQDTIHLVFTLVQSPRNIINLMRKFTKEEYLPFIFLFADRALRRTKECMEQFRSFYHPSVVINVLEKEQKDLELLRKTLDDKLKTQLDESIQLKEKLLKELPNYVINSTEESFHSIKNDCLKVVLDSVLRKKQNFENQVAADPNLAAEFIEKETKSINEYLEKIINFAIDSEIGIFVPQNLSAIMKQFHGKKEHLNAVTIGKRALEILKELRKQQIERVMPTQRYLLLQNDKETLLQQRNELPEESKKALRELTIEQELFAYKPKFYSLSQAEYDRIAFSLCHLMINCALDKKKELEEKIELDSQANEAEVSDSTKASHSLVAEMVEVCEKNVLIVENLIKVVSILSKKLEYGLVLKLGKKVQIKINEVKEQVKKIIKLEEEKTELTQKIKVDRSFETRLRLREVEIGLAELPLKYQSTRVIDDMILKTGNMMMNSAKVENDNETLKQQAILVFKINTNMQTFGEVKILTEDKDWPALRKELLDFVVATIKKIMDDKAKGIEEPENNYSDDDGDDDDDVDEDLYYSDSDEEAPEYNPKKKTKAKKAAKTARGKKRRGIVEPRMERAGVKEMIDLLLNEGLWRESLKVFPEPGQGSIELLEKLWLQVEQNDAKLLSEVLPMVQKYVTKAFLDYNLDPVSTLLDMIQKQNPKILLDMFKQITDQMLLNITQKQYLPFANALKIIKKKLDEKLWKSFFDELSKKQKTKKKLMQTIQQEFPDESKADEPKPARGRGRKAKKEESDDDE